MQDSLVKHGTGNGSDSLVKAGSNDSPISAAFSELLKAYKYAHDAGRDVWDLAVEISLLREFGLTPSDLRWLVCKGYVQHARDVTRMDDDSREFRKSTQLVFAKRTCFVLTDDGAAYARSLLSSESRVPQLQRKLVERPNSNNKNGTLSSHSKSIKPRWDGERHELWVGDQLVKQFKGHALNQETILAVFEEESWPPQIDDPLPLADEIDPKRRLHDTIKCLNRKQRHELIHFRGDGSGEGVIWELNGLRD